MAFKEGEVGLKKINVDKDKISLTQNDNYHINKYEIFIKHPIIENVLITKNSGDKTAGEKVDETRWKVVVDFNDKALSIIISFKKNIVDPIEIPIVYIDADKGAWDEKEFKEYSDKLSNIVNIKFTYYNSLINILFNSVNEEYSYSVATLYYVFKNNDGDKVYQFMGKFKSDSDNHFIPIVNLGYASYAIELRQYNELNEIIYESDRIEFVIEPTRYNNQLII